MRLDPDADPDPDPDPGPNPLTNPLTLTLTLTLALALTLTLTLALALTLTLTLALTLANPNPNPNPSPNPNTNLIQAGSLMSRECVSLRRTRATSFSNATGSKPMPRQVSSAPRVSGRDDTLARSRLRSRLLCLLSSKRLFLRL